MSPNERHVDDIGSAENFLAAIDATIKLFNDGDIVEGTIVKVDRNAVLVDIGSKTYGFIPARELSVQHDVDPRDLVNVGDAVEALVLQKEDKEGRLILSKKRAQYERAWGTIEKIKEEDGVVTGTVIEVVKGGLILDIGLRGFLPDSLVEMRRVRDLQPYVGKVLEARIIELDRKRNNVVLSRRAWLEQSMQVEVEVDRGAPLAPNDDLRKKLADKEQELRQRELEFTEVRAAADHYMREGSAARSVARALWAAMPRAEQLAYIESDSVWLPKWIVEEEGLQ
ncbi:transcriptional accessory protein Tex/SPT6 [Cellulomonas humilata]|uniref:Transcriptional accessory protein Tex/SPT6 n=1 Tax=Cellulomonas humilata TaxID=144055 RepID=A0ABU0ELS4_9CELL|nr:transcriptional accessory protein Tex/SPT6 [Cellulomonas humilata]